jgi:hypothetical protein
MLLSAHFAELSWGKDSTIYPFDTSDADALGSNPALIRHGTDSRHHHPSRVIWKPE